MDVFTNSLFAFTFSFEMISSVIAHLQRYERKGLRKYIQILLLFSQRALKNFNNKKTQSSDSVSSTHLLFIKSESKYKLTSKFLLLNSLATENLQRLDNIFS